MANPRKMKLAPKMHGATTRTRLRQTPAHDAVFMQACSRDAKRFGAGPLMRNDAEQDANPQSRTRPHYHRKNP